MFILSPPVVSSRVLAVRGGAKPYFFQTFQLSPLVVSPEILVAKGGTMWARNGRWILPEMPDFHVAFRNLLHAVNLRYGTDGFTSPPKEGVLRPGLNPRTWVPKASTLPLDQRSRLLHALHVCVILTVLLFGQPNRYSGGYAVAQLAEALPYKPEDHVFYSRWCHWNFSLT